MSVIRLMAYAVVVATLSTRAPADESPRPNVLFIVCDDLNTHVSTSGYTHIHTPAFDDLAKAGMTLRRAYCQYPVCGPSRASFLSGLYPESTNLFDNKADIRTTRPNTPSLPELFHNAGYWTAAVGKVFHSIRQDPGSAVWNERRYFDDDELPIVRQAREKFEAEHGPISARTNRTRWKELETTIATQTRGQVVPGYGPSGLDDTEHADGKNVRQVVNWLRQRSYGEKPFFVACGIQKPHVPFLAPQRYYDLYPRDGLHYLPDPPDDWNDIPLLAQVSSFESYGFALGRENDALRRTYMQAYHACVSYIDAQLGLLLQEFRQQNLWDDTIVVFTSDHGFHLGEHFMWSKVTLFEESARVPLIIRVPGHTRADSRSDALVELVDLLPTLAELCGVPAPANVQGQSIVRLLADPAERGKEAAYTIVSRGLQFGRSIRTEKWRYAEWGDRQNAELYDLQTDPREHHNLAGLSQYAHVVRMLNETLAARTRYAQSRASPAE